MTGYLLGLLPWQAWLVLAVGTSTLRWAAGWQGEVARREHRLTCRAYWQLMAVLEGADESMQVAWAWVLTPWLGRVITGLWLFCCAGDALRWVLRQPPHPPKQWATPFGGPAVRRFTTTVGTAREAWRHHDHDDDCEHGPTRRWFGATAKLQRWRKVAVNPDFAPA